MRFYFVFQSCFFLAQSYRFIATLTVSFIYFLLHKLLFVPHISQKNNNFFLNMPHSFWQDPFFYSKSSGLFLKIRHYDFYGSISVKQTYIPSNLIGLQQVFCFCISIMFLRGTNHTILSSPLKFISSVPYYTNYFLFRVFR